MIIEKIEAGTGCVFMVKRYSEFAIIFGVGEYARISLMMFDSNS